MEKKTAVFAPADILLPKPGSDFGAYSVVACDQYTSEPEYWERVRRRTEGKPSAYHMILPEADLEKPGFAGRIAAVNQAMSRLLEEDFFASYPDSMIYVERTLRSGETRRGLVGRIDLEQYDYRPGAASLIRATEGTVLERIPPRMRIRENAPLELPHVMLLVDDPEQGLIEPMARQAGNWQKLYDFTLMEEGGRLCGWRLDNREAERVQEYLERLQKPGEMLFAVGDGNHSLAAAKACYEALKRSLPEAEAACHPARYALVELVNLHDASLEFEPIHRVAFGVDAGQLLAAWQEQLRGMEQSGAVLQPVTAVLDSREEDTPAPCPAGTLAVGLLQDFLDSWLAEHGGRVDYIHGEEVVRELCRGKGDTIGFLLPAMEKSELFPAVMHRGALPRKTFSMGEACDKRFYLEARKIR